LADPYSGIAHLLEHMLFVQSKKYGPKVCSVVIVSFSHAQAKEYHNFIAKNSGGTNASTSSERTTFYFYIPVGFFEQALDIFAQFFVAPAFDRAAVEREISAVNSEHVKNLTSDSWRMQQMNRSLAGESPYRHFSTGSEKTLLHDLRAAGVDVCSVCLLCRVGCFLVSDQRFLGA
jgi:insulysin